MATLATTIIGTLGFLYNAYKQSTNEDEAKAALDRIKKYYDEIPLPDIEKQKLSLEAIKYQGDVIPPEIASRYEQITEDPRLIQAQRQALTQLQDIGAQRGLTATDRARLEEIALQEAQRERGAREAIQQRALQTGTMGSGLELASQLQAQQAAAGRRALGGFQTARAAEQRALQAIMGAGQLGGQIRGQEFGMASERARALDAIAKFNAANRMQAAMRNLGTRQSLAAQNVGIRNLQQMKNKALIQQDYMNRLRKAQGMAGAEGMQYDYYQPMGERYADRALKSWRGLGTTFGLDYEKDKDKEK